MITPSPVMKRLMALSYLLLAILWLNTTNTLAAERVRLPSHLHLGTWSPYAIFWEALTTVCLSHASAAGIYRVTATDTFFETHFSLTNEVGSQVPYSVFWGNGPSVHSEEQLKPGIPSKNIYTVSPNRHCGPTAQKHMRVQVLRADFDNAIPGVYQGGVSLTLSPL